MEKENSTINFISESENKGLQIDRNTALEMVKLYSHEWEYRHKNYWQLFFRFSIIAYIIILLPYIYDILNANQLAISFPRFLFPIVGIVISTVQLLLLLSESIRLTAVNVKINQLIAAIGHDYCKIDYKSLKREVKNNKLLKSLVDLEYFIYDLRISKAIVIINFVIQVAIAGFIIFY